MFGKIDQCSVNNKKMKKKILKTVWEKCELKKKYRDFLVIISSSSAYILIRKVFGFVILGTDVAGKKKWIFDFLDLCCLHLTYIANKYSSFLNTYWVWRKRKKVLFLRALEFYFKDNLQVNILYLSPKVSLYAYYNFFNQMSDKLLLL